MFALHGGGPTLTLWLADGNPILGDSGSLPSVDGRADSAVLLLANAPPRLHLTWRANGRTTSIPRLMARSDPVHPDL